MQQSELKSELKNVIDYYQKELSALRVGRATPALVENIQVEYYGTKTPLIQLASINTPDTKTIVVQPWDKGALKDVERALNGADLGTSPIIDGDVIRIQMPPLTEERRTQVVKLVKEKSEQAKIRIRQIREEVMKELKKQKDSGDLSEDTYFREEKEVQQDIDQAIDGIATQEKSKEDEIMKL
ncbi:MAG: ribosome recycling factor [bacterium]|nr:ribosome recycling factor [bacterium]